MRPVIFLTLAAFLFFGLAGCAAKAKVETLEKQQEIPPAPAEGTYLAEPAERVPIAGGPESPARKRLSQVPADRPCWALTEGKGCPLSRPGFQAFVGTSSGAATREGAILNAYQNAVEMLAAYCFEKSGAASPDARERARARAYSAAGISDKTYRLREGAWTQMWEERGRNHKRVYHRAFVRLVVSEAEILKLFP